MVPSDDVGSPAPIDRPILEYVRDRLGTTAQVARVELSEADGHLELRATLDESYYPSGVDGATLFVRWYTNDDFTIHYREQHADDDWECRWDRHPSTHNDREHYHPPPAASTPGEDETWPTDYREVLRLVLDEIEARIQTLWTA